MIMRKLEYIILIKGQNPIFEADLQNDLSLSQCLLKYFDDLTWGLIQLVVFCLYYFSNTTLIFI